MIVAGIFGSNMKDNIGRIRAICISERKGTPKTEVEEARFLENFGIENDAHAGKWHRQVSLLEAEAVEAFKLSVRTVPDDPENAETEPVEILPGAFGENLLVEGIDLKALPCGSIFTIGDVRLKLTQRGKECHEGCVIRKKTGDCIMPREGVFAEVIHGGCVRKGDTITVETPSVDRPYRAAVITLSDKASRGERKDESGPILAGLLEGSGFEVIEELILPDEEPELVRNLIRLADNREADLIITTGGTGFSERDITPEATMKVSTKNAPGIAEAIRARSLEITPKAMLSRGASVIRNRTLIINFPGSPKAVRESFEVIEGVIGHGLGILTGREGECARK